MVSDLLPAGSLSVRMPSSCRSTVSDTEYENVSTINRLRPDHDPINQPSINQSIPDRARLTQRISYNRIKPPFSHHMSFLNRKHCSATLPVPVDASRCQLHWLTLLHDRYFHRLIVPFRAGSFRQPHRRIPRRVQAIYGQENQRLALVFVIRVDI